MDDYFSVSESDLSRLTMQEAVARFRELLWAEARRLGVPIGKIHVSSRVNVADGGVDASIEANAISSSGTSLIRLGRTGYQIKTGTSFQPWQKANIIKELFGDKAQAKDNLAPSVKSCLDDSGAYIVVLFGHDPVESQRLAAVTNIRECLQLCGYGNPEVEVWGQNNILGFLQPYPSLALRINRRQTGPFQTHSSWSQNRDMATTFQAGDEQTARMSTLQDALRRNRDAEHIRVLGEPGIGKTRLVLEATKADDLQPLVLYLGGPAQFLGSPLMSDILREDSLYSVVLVIDECDQENAAVLWNILKNRGPRIKLVTIYNDYDDAHHENRLDAPPLPDEQIIRILDFYGIPADEARRYVEFCSGSPRVAHILGENLQNNREDLLRSPSTVNLWRRYIAGRDSPTSDQARQRELVLQHIALFKRFGYREPLVEDARMIATLIEDADHEITWNRFQNMVANLVNRRILQGDNVLYITPKALHIKLWLDWWDTYRHGLDLEQFRQRFSPRLVSWFDDMFKYASSSAATLHITRRYLGPEGPFQSGEYLQTEQGADFFLALSEADAASALRLLERVLGNKSKEQLLRFTTGRRQVIHALEMIAVWRDLFIDAARILLQLAEAENETWSNNATGVFIDLFSPGYGPVSPTEASLRKRFPVLREALGSTSPEKRTIALLACKKALETRHFYRVIGREYQGLRKRPELWTPKTYGELFDAYREVWQLVREHMRGVPEEQKQDAFDVLLDRARDLLEIPKLSDMVVDTIDEVSGESWVDKAKALQAVVQILHYSRDVADGLRHRLEQVRDTLTGTGFSALLRRYVGIHLTEDYYDEKGNFVGYATTQIENLAQEAFDKPALLEEQLPWLISSEAQYSHSFGFELGKKDQDFALLPVLLSAQRRAGSTATSYLLGGYLSALFQNNREMWERTLDALAEDQSLNKLLPDLTARSGLTERAALRILGLAERQAIEPLSFQAFGYGRVVQEISEDVFRQWISFLLDASQDVAGIIALNLYFTYYILRDPELRVPEASTFTLLTHRNVLRVPQTLRRDSYEWAELAKRFVRLYPKRSVDLARVMLMELGEEESIITFHSPSIELLTGITRAHPDEIWQFITQHIGRPRDARAFFIGQWLHGEFSFAEEQPDGPVTLFLADDIWEWIDADVNNRAWRVATFVPKRLFREADRPCLARELLVRYGEREDVQRNLQANFVTEGWSGSETLHLSKKRQMLVDYRKDEDNYNVRRWLDDFISYLDERIQDARLREEMERYC